MAIGSVAIDTPIAALTFKSEISTTNKTQIRMTKMFFPKLSKKCVLFISNIDKYMYMYWLDNAYDIVTSLMITLLNLLLVYWG